MPGLDDELEEYKSKLALLKSKIDLNSGRLSEKVKEPSKIVSLEDTDSLLLEIGDLIDAINKKIKANNLESNILCSNSLVDEFEGVRLVKESDLLGSTGDYQRDITSDRFDTIIRKLIETQDELFRCADTEEKKQLKEQIESLRDMIILTQLEGCDSAIIERYYDTKQMASKPYILWQLDFERVFKEKGGFDIVIGNPPYIDSENMVNQGLEEERNLLAKRYSFTKGNWDIYIAFFERGYRLLSGNGTLSYITPDKWISKPFGAEMRKIICKRGSGNIVARTSFT